MKVKTEHPYIIKTEGTCGGRARIKKTRISVRDVVEKKLNGYSSEEIVKAHSGLSLAEVYDALSYYYDHKDEIDKEIKENKDVDHWFNQMKKAGVRVHQG